MTQEEEDGPQTHHPGPRGSKAPRQTSSIGLENSKKYDEAYLNLGFTWMSHVDWPQPQCVVCSEVCSHLNTVPDDVSQKPPGTVFTSKNWRG